MTALRTAVVGCGLIGRRRAKTASDHSDSVLTLVIDNDEGAVSKLAGELGCRSATDWRAAIDADVDAVIVSTPNYLLAPIAVAALESGKHVLLEKPMARNLDEALTVQRAAAESGCRVKVGYNHRYHPGIRAAYEAVKSGTIGKPMNARARYGHGGRPGYDKEWRADPELSGGGELHDQGSHIIDLFNWFLGRPIEVCGMLQTAFWQIAPLEDNAFGLLAYDHGVVASFHTSWTQWKNMFSFEVYGSKGYVAVEGLGGSYGVETLTVGLRRPEGGAPEISEQLFDGPDISWEAEWDDFLSHVENDGLFLGTLEDGIEVLRVVELLGETGTFSSLNPQA